MKQVAKTAADKARQVATQTAKQIGRELLEIPKQAAAEAVGIKVPGVPGDEAKKTDEAPGFDKAKAQQQVNNRLDYLEKELEELKRKREAEKQQEQYLTMQKQKQEEEERQKKMQEIFQPPKRKLRIPGFGQKKPKGTGEFNKKVN